MINRALMRALRRSVPKDAAPTPFPPAPPLAKAKELRTDGQPRSRTPQPYDDVAFAAPGRLYDGAAPNPAPGLKARRAPWRQTL
jgi:hypothetical protein